MIIQDLITELQKYPALSSVFIDVDGEIQRLSDTAEVWVRSAGKWGGMQGPYTIAGSGADDYGVLLV